MPVNVKVSVVVAVYNPGPNINGLISSLNAQSLDPAELEVVFVDDGSTDGTPERLADVARDHQNFVVTTIPNSGWPGRPRNVGTALARGEYVFYADHDDEFFPEALERMYAMAVAERSDIVYGKIVRSGRSTPYWSLAQANLANADVMHAVASRTVHKLYRREFLSEHQIRFPEGRVRLEDHNFMAQALPHARVVSVLADYPCYRWIHRSDGTNNSNAKVDRRKYWEYYGGVLRTMETSSGPGPLLDATRVTAIMQAFSRFSPRSYLQQDPADRAMTFDALHEIVIEHFPPELDERMPVLKRLRVQALRSGELTRFEQQQRCRTKMQFGLSDAQVAWVDGRVVVGLDASAVSVKGVPLAMDRLGDDLALPAELGAPTGAAAARCVLTTTERGTGEITIRHREIGIEWPVESVEHQKAPRTGDKATLRMHLDGTVDPARSIFGRELETGIWDVLIRMQFLGENQVRRARRCQDTAARRAPAG
ncbi:MAG: glycosyltransferase family 2 protein [Actinobacteria bacterium]|nr:glycosyltransferase family 2 protein [Actinomycetota bacterium]